MIAAMLQGAGLIGLTVGGVMIADAGGGLIGVSVSAVYAGLAWEHR